MPTFQIITGAFIPEQHASIAEQIGIASGNVGQPIDEVKVVFLAPQAVFLRGKEPVSPATYARVDVTIGGLTDQQRRQLARDVCGLLCDAGAREDAVTLFIHDATGRNVASGRGEFPFWPEQAG
jgi:phenylpyruvate tautomerase PptA (4-oxalocrotonate tautomerase family)